jgi:NAD(P)-dependent dehydrogenase (short-subunit alcohol dehydrogenase family)
MSALLDRPVLVTGAYRGIGAACARAFAAVGARVACADIRKPEETLAALDGAGHPALVCDVADEASVSAMFDEIARRSEASTRWCTVPGSSTRPRCSRRTSPPSTG